MRRLTQQDFEQRVYGLYGDIVILGKYHKTRTKIEVKCTVLDDMGFEHGDYHTAGESLLNQGKGCQKCANNKRSQAQTRFTHNKNFFVTPNITNCYWAGFIAADGCIVDDRHLTVGVKISDIAYVKKFCDDLEYNGTIYKGSSVLRGVEYGNCQIQISNAEKLIFDLKENFRIEQRKSLTYTRPPLEDDLALSFIKGYIDGDGHIDTTKRVRLHVCGTYETLSWIKTIFDEYSPAHSANGFVANVRLQGNIFVYEIGAKRALKMLNILAALPTPALSRKWYQIRDLH